MGWKIELKALPSPPFVFIGAPHTSNWDFMLMLATVLSLQLDARWLGKNSLFTPPFRGLMCWLGGIPIDRSKRQNSVEQTVEILQTKPNLIVCVSPEGTRAKVDRWKTGFYYIALQATVPIEMTVIDAEARCIRLLGTYVPTGNAKCEIAEIQEKYQGFQGIIPENCFEIPKQTVAQASTISSPQ